MSNVVSSPDLVTIFTNVGVFLAAVGTVIAAIWGAAKKIKSVMPDDPGATKIVGGSIMDTTTMIMFTESQREMMAAMRETTRELVELRHTMERLKDSFDG